MRHRRLPLAVAVVATALVVFTAQAALGVIKTKTGKGVKATVAVTETAASTTSSLSFVNLPGATATITVASGTTAFLLARFSAESACYGGGAATDWCSVRMLVNGGFEFDPPSGADFAFDSPESGSEATPSYESHAIERAFGPLNAGTYTVTLQRRVLDPDIVFHLDDWAFIVQSIKIS